jgi:hypothetical protein
MRARIFIGSASAPDRMRTTTALAHRLQKDFGVIPRVWTYVFPATENTLSSLVAVAQEVDFAIFVLGPDDLLLKNPTGNAAGKGGPAEGEKWTTRDNVVFEMGLLIGTLGMDRCFAVLPEQPRHLFAESQRQLHIFTDYAGTNFCTYIATKEAGLDPLDAVFAACQEIGQQVERLGPRPINAFRALFGPKKQAVVVYPHITAETKGIRTTEHNAGGALDTKDYTWSDNVQRREVAHFDDLRAVNAIAELCGRMQVNVIATTDGFEQAEIQSLDTISFSIGLLNGFTRQAFAIVARDTDYLLMLNYINRADTRTTAEISFNGKTYPRTLDADAPEEDRKPDDPNHAILVRTFLRSGGGPPILRFVCGGIDAAGTAVAGVYLKYHWRELLKYYEHFGKDLEQDSLGVLLQFWGRKAESARPVVAGISFFKPGRCEFYEPDLKEATWRSQETHKPPEKTVQAADIPPKTRGNGGKPKNRG